MTTESESRPGRDPSAFFQRLLPNSRLAVNMALTMLHQDGLEGWMMVYIPADTAAPCEVMTTTQGWSLSMDPSTFNPRNRRR